MNGTTGKMEALADPWVDPSTGLAKEDVKERWPAPFDQGVSPVYCVIWKLLFLTNVDDS